MKENIGKFSLGYALLKPYIRFVHNYMYYNSVEVNGLENVPKKGAVIYAPNHQNNLMDPLAVLFAMSGQPVFMARGDLFRHPIAKKVMTFLKIMPIYRKQDGIKSPSENNQSMFDLASSHLSQKRELVILPEGNSFPIKKLRVVKKGLARIAFQTEEQCNFDLDLKIIPVGLDYDDFDAHGSNLSVVFGKALTVKNYNQVYREFPAKGVNMLTQDVGNAIKPLILHCETDTVAYLTTLLQSDYSIPQSKQVIRSQQIADQLHKLHDNNEMAFSELAEDKKDLEKLLSENDFTIQSWVQGMQPIKKVKALEDVLQFPLFLYGAVHHIIPLMIAKYAGSKSKPIDFFSTFQFAVFAALLPVFYFVYTGIFALNSIDKIPILLYAFSLPVSGVVFTKMKAKYKLLKAKLKYRRLKKSKPEAYQQIKKQYQLIVEKFHKITEKQFS